MGRVLGLLLQQQLLQIGLSLKSVAGTALFQNAKVKSSL